jgi:hypothetical protein
MRWALVFLAACGAASSSGADAPAESATPPAVPPGQAPLPPPPPANPPQADGGTPDVDAGDTTKTYRNSLSVCWTDATCKRAMIVAHGGDWTPTGAPYGSLAAVTNAYKNGAEAVKIDVRVTKDDVPVVSHSSPFEIYESLDCYGKKIEDMTAAQVTACHFASSSSETFQRLDTMLGYIKGKMVVQLCVKKSSDYARTIAEVLALAAQDFAFIEVGSPSDLPALPNSVYYLVNFESDLSQVDAVMANPRAFMFEMNPSAEISSLVATKLHPANIRSFTYDSNGGASVAELKGLFDQGFDVVSTNATANNLQARIAVNGARGVTPP